MESDEGLDSAIIRATIGARMFEAAPYRIGRFTVVRRLGAGGMGVVYLGYDPDLEREVAIKVLRSDAYTDATASERSRNQVLAEAQAMAKLRHPNVVVVHEVGEHEGGLFVAMEYVRGTTLRGWVTSTPRTVAEIVAAYVAAGRGLVAAHDAGLVHRDFKPDNVLVGEDGRVLVTDFGLARAQGGLASTPDDDDDDDDADADADADAKRTGIAGTLLYMAPECLTGRPATAASDQFSYCVSLFEALWGARPFGDSQADLADRVRNDVVPRPPSTPRVRASIRTAVLRGLARDPAARFASMPELLRRLDRDRHASAWGWGTAAALGLAAAALWWRQPAACVDLDAEIRALWNPERSQAIAATFAASGRPYAGRTWTAIAERVDGWTTAWAAEATAACRATEVQQTQSNELRDRRVACLDRRRRELAALLDVLARADDVAIERGATAAERLRRPEACADLEALDRRAPPPEDPDARARYDEIVDAVATARAEYDTGHFAPARALAEVAVRDAIALGHRPTEAEAQLVLGDAFDELGETDASRRALDAAIAAAEAGGVDETSALGWIELAYVETWSGGDQDAADRALTMGFAELEALGNPHELHALATKVRAAILAARGRYDEAEPLARAAVDELLLAAAGPVRVAAARLGVGTLLFEAGRYEEALAWIREARDGFDGALGPEHPHTLSARANLANVLGQLRRVDEALAEHLEVLELRERSLGPMHPSLGANLNAIATAYFFRQQYASAVEYQRRAVALAVATRGADHPDALTIRENLGVFLLEAGQLDEALAVATAALADRRRVQGADHPDVVGSIASVAAIELRLGRQGDAAKHFDESLALGVRVLGPDNARLLDVYRGIAETALARGEPELARTAAAHGRAIVEKEYGPGHIKSAALLRFAADAEAALGNPGEATKLRGQADAITLANARP